MASKEAEDGELQDQYRNENDYQTHDGDNQDKSNDDKKIFVGGLSYSTTSEDLAQHFRRFGDVVSAQVKYDHETNRSRGFAFVEFTTTEACHNAMTSREQEIQGKMVEVKPAKSRENKKIFVGGLSTEFPEEELRAYFEQYGKVEDIEWPIDRQTNTRRQFAFVVFEEEEIADRAAAIAKHQFGDRECDVKKAVPMRKRGWNAMGGTYGGRASGQMRGSGYGMGRGNGAGGWYGGGGYGYGQQGYGTGGWGDMYNAANYNAYYGQQASQYGGAGGYGLTGNAAYDFGTGANQPQQQSSSSQQRYPRQY